MDPAIRSAILRCLAVHKDAYVPIPKIAREASLTEDLVRDHIDVLAREGLVEYPSGMGAGRDEARITSRGSVEVAMDVAKRFVDGQGGATITSRRGTAVAGGPCPPVIPGTYNGRVTINGQPVPDGTAIQAFVDDLEWGNVATSGGRYVMDIPDFLPTDAPCFEGGTVEFRSGNLTALQRPVWRSGLHNVDLSFQGSSTQLNTRATGPARVRTPGRVGTGRAAAGGAVAGPRPDGTTDHRVDEAATQYFVAHEFTAEKTDDLRRAIDEALAESGLMPYYADNEVRQGHILTEKIVPKIRSTRFGIYDLSNPDKANVFLELGVAIGMGKPYLIVCARGTKLPSDVLGLDRIEYDSYVDLTRQLKAKVAKALRGGP